MTPTWILLLALLPATGEDRIDRTLHAMGTSLRISVEATDRRAAVAVSERAILSVEAVEARLSTWLPDSELSRLNRAPGGEAFRLSRGLASDLTAARTCTLATSGAFDPTVGALARAWGLREGGRLPSEAEINRALEATGMEALEARGETVVRTHAGLIIEEGAFGKGIGLDAALDVLSRDPRVLRAELDFGGQIAVIGADAGWQLTLADPRDRERSALAIELDGERISVATSGNSERGIEAGGRRHGHLLDPRTGRPAMDFGSLTVWAEEALWADCLATGLYVLGPEEALRWAAGRPGVEVLTLEVSGNRLEARATPGFAGRLSPLAAGLEVEIVEARLSSKEDSTASP